MARSSRRSIVPRQAFTLVELLVATALTLLMMGMVVSIFSLVSDNVTGSRATLEMNDRLRSVADRLQYDLQGITAQLKPPRSPSSGEGYFEYIEGPVGPVIPPWVAAVNTDGATGAIDSTAGDNDDILMFTTRSAGEPFIGKFGGQVATSPVAEVCWFVRGTTLYRRQLLVLPHGNSTIAIGARQSAGFYVNYDVSVHQTGGASNVLVCNSLGDLTNRENRYGHQPFAWPYDARFWSKLGLPTLEECSFADTTNNPAVPLWPFPLTVAGEWWVTPEPAGPIIASERLIVPFVLDSSNNNVSPSQVNAGTQGARLALTTAGAGFDPWRQPNAWAEVNRRNGLITAYAGDPDPNTNPVYSILRRPDDVVLTNVLSFDVKVYDLGAPVFERNDAGGNPVALLPGDVGYLRNALAPYSTGAAAPAGNAPTAYGAFVDLNYMCLDDNDNDNTIDYVAPAGAPLSQFADSGNGNSGLQGTPPFRVTNWTDPSTYPAPNVQFASVYDTWTTAYEKDGLDNNLVDGADEAADGLGDTGTMEAPPPYAAPVKAIQIKIRVFESDSRQIREITITQDFRE